MRTFGVGRVVVLRICDVGTSGGATWPVHVLRLLPATAHGYRCFAEDRQNRHMLTPEGQIGQVGFSMLVFSLVMTEWLEELLWRITQVSLGDNRVDAHEPRCDSGLLKSS